MGCDCCYNAYIYLYADLCSNYRSTYNMCNVSIITFHQGKYKQVTVSDRPIDSLYTFFI